MIDRIGDGRRYRHGRQLAKTLSAQRARLLIEAAYEQDIEFRNIRQGHRTPEAARLYVKRTDPTRSGSRKRRAWVESGSNDERSEAESEVALAKKSE